MSATACACRDLLTLAEGAQRLGIAESGVLRLHRLAGLPLVRIGQADFILWSAVEDWARARVLSPHQGDCPDRRRPVDSRD